MMTARPATAKDVEGIFAGTPARSMRGIVFERDGKVLGCFGAYLQGSAQVVFFDGDHDEVTKEPMALLRHGMAFLRSVQRLGIPIYARCDAARPRAAALLEWAGFVPVDPKGEVYQWQA